MTEPLRYDAEGKRRIMAALADLPLPPMCPMTRGDHVIEPLYDDGLVCPCCHKTWTFSVDGSGALIEGWDQVVVR